MPCDANLMPGSTFTLSRLYLFSFVTAAKVNHISAVKEKEAVRREKTVTETRAGEKAAEEKEVLADGIRIRAEYQMASHMAQPKSVACNRRSATRPSIS